MLMKSLSNKDVALIKKALKFLKKNQELKADTEFRLDFLLGDITKDEKEQVFKAVYETVYKNKTRKDLLDGKKSYFLKDDELILICKSIDFANKGRIFDERQEFNADDLKCDLEQYIKH